MESTVTSEIQFTEIAYVRRSVDGFNGHITPQVRFVMNVKQVDFSDGAQSIFYEVKAHKYGSGRLMKVMELSCESVGDSNLWFCRPWFGGMFPIEADSLEQTLSLSMEYFKCFVTGTGQFHKDEVKG